MRRLNWRGALFWLVILLMVFASLAGVVSNFGFVWWPLDVVAQFRAQWLWLSCLCTILIFVMARRKRRWLCIVGLAGVGAVLPALWRCMRLPESATGAPSLAIAHINVGAPVEKPVELMKVIAQSSADLVFLQEVRAELEPSLATLEAYRVILRHPRPDTRGVAVLVRNHLRAEANLIHPAEQVTKRPTPVVRMKLGETDIVLFNASLGRPGSAEKDKQQRAVLSALATLAEKEQAEGRCVIILGDFNCAPWSTPPQVLVDTARLRPAPLGPLLNGTWPSCLPWPLRMPIDHAFVDPLLRVTQLERLRTVGSDHLGIKLSVESSSR